NHPLYLNTEFCGHMFPTKHIDNVERVQEHVRRHAHIHNILGSDDQYAGGIGWCAFDYNTHGDFGSGDRICYHGVSDIFRIPKPAADFYRSQCDPAEEKVLAPAFHWAIGDRSGGGGPGTGFISSNCDHLKIYVGDVLTAEVDPDREHFGHLPHPPFVCERLRGLWGQKWHDLRIEGYVNGEKVITHRMSAAGVDREFHLEADDDSLIGDGIDATRVVFRVTDEYGNPRPFATGAIQLTLEGPGEIIGENPFALTGGVGAVWVRTAEAGGTIRLTARHPFLSEKAVEIAVSAAEPEAC
ncbi:MAG TPA: glycoside hydrolase family 2 protein, partial [Chloroflexota bacterium]|nr:glycoside hydrolase family 2 protein [Chloroflexota bacterium]